MPQNDVMSIRSPQFLLCVDEMVKWYHKATLRGAGLIEWAHNNLDAADDDGRRVGA